MACWVGGVGDRWGGVFFLGGRAGGGGGGGGVFFLGWGGGGEGFLGGGGVGGGWARGGGGETPGERGTISISDRGRDLKVQHVCASMRLHNKPVGWRIEVNCRTASGRFSARRGVARRCES